MVSKARVLGTPKAWSKLVRDHLSRVHTLQVSYRRSNRSRTHYTCAEIVVAEILSDEEGEDGEPEVIPASPADAPILAAAAYEKAWEHLESTEDSCRQLWYTLTLWGWDEEKGAPVELEETGRGGALRKDGTVEDEDEDESDLKAINLKMIKAAFDMLERSYEKRSDDWVRFGEFVEKVTDLVNTNVEQRSEMAGKRLEFREAELEHDADMHGADKAADAVAYAVNQFSPGINAWLIGQAAQNQAPATEREPHPMPAIEAARKLIDALDGHTMVRVRGVLGVELTDDMLQVLTLAMSDDADPHALKNAWLELVPLIQEKQSALGSALGMVKAGQLGTLLLNLHSAVMAID